MNPFCLHYPSFQRKKLIFRDQVSGRTKISTSASNIQIFQVLWSPTSLLSPRSHLLGLPGPCAAASPGPCLPQMKKPSVSGHAGASGHAEVSDPTGASGQEACPLAHRETPYPGTCPCMSRRSGRARTRCWTLQSVLWSE